MEQYKIDKALIILNRIRKALSKKCGHDVTVQCKNIDTQNACIILTECEEKVEDNFEGHYDWIKG